MGQVVAGVLTHDALAPEHAADLPVANAHRHNGHNVGQRKVNNVVSVHNLKKGKDTL